MTRQGMFDGIDRWFAALSTIYSCVSATVSLTICGWLLVLASALEISAAFCAVHAGRRSFHFVGAALMAATGVVLIAHRAIGADAPTVSLLFLVSGLYRVVGGIVLDVPRWGWALVSAALTVAFGLAILARWPTDSTWVVGTYAGVALMLGGWGWVMIAIVPRERADRDCVVLTLPRSSGERRAFNSRTDSR